MPADVETWFITGCSSGFGESLVRKLRAEGTNVIATGRNADTKLAHLADTGAKIMDLDVSAPPAEIKAKIDEACGLFPNGIDVVVNNAGYILSGALEELDPVEVENVMKTNFHGPFNITQSILPHLRAKNKGALLYVGSQAGWHGDPSAAGYCSSKFALEGMVECLAKELELFAPGIKVLIVEPGYHSTQAFVKCNLAPSRVADYAAYTKGIHDFVHATATNEPGDQDKAVDRMIELVRGTGMAAGRKVPLRVPLGSDGWDKVKTKCEETLKICDEWYDVAKSTDKLQ